MYFKQKIELNKVTIDLIKHAAYVLHTPMTY